MPILQDGMFYILIFFCFYEILINWKLFYRLLRYSRANNISTVLIDGLAFANGLAFSPQEEFVVVAETVGLRIQKYYLKGSKEGTTETFIDGLPGAPDNLTPDAEGLWVPLVISADSDHPFLPAIAAKVPLIRLFISRLFHLLEMPFKIIENLIPNYYTKKIVHYMGHFETIGYANPQRNTIVRMDWNGNILGSLHGFDGSVVGISHVLEFKDYLYFGSPFNKYLARMKLPKGQKIRVSEVNKQETVKPVEKPKVKPTEVPKTTQKPTEKPKPTEAPKTTQKPTEKPKPTEAPKATEKPKPTEVPKVVPKPTEAPKVVPKPEDTFTSEDGTVRMKRKKVESKPNSAESGDGLPIIKVGYKDKTKTEEEPKKAEEIPVKKAPPAYTPKYPAPIAEDLTGDTKAPEPPKLKVIKKGGEQVEL